jgi:hypothetical protein
MRRLLLFHLTGNMDILPLRSYSILGCRSSYQQIGPPVGTPQEEPRLAERKKRFGGVLALDLI